MKMSRAQKRQVLQNNPGVFQHDNHFYSISSKNRYNEFIVIKMTQDMTTGEMSIEGTAIVKASSIKGVQQQIGKYPFEQFKKFENNSLH
jgi:hypothetical protein